MYSGTGKIEKNFSSENIRKSGINRKSAINRTSAINRELTFIYTSVMYLFFFSNWYLIQSDGTIGSM